MNKALVYCLMQYFGYRKLCYDWQRRSGLIPEGLHEQWEWKPWRAKGTYRETANGWTFAGYGVGQ